MEDLKEKKDDVEDFEINNNENSINPEDMEQLRNEILKNKDELQSESLENAGDKERCDNNQFIQNKEDYNHLIKNKEISKNQQNSGKSVLLKDDIDLENSSNFDFESFERRNQTFADIPKSKSVTDKDNFDKNLKCNNVDSNYDKFSEDKNSESSLDDNNIITGFKPLKLKSDKDKHLSLDNTNNKGKNNFILKFNNKVSLNSNENPVANVNFEINNNNENELIYSSPIEQQFKIDSHYEKIGYNFFHYRMLLIISLIFFVDSCEMSNVNMLLSSIQKDLNLNTFQKSSLSSSIFIGFFTGSFLSGFITNKYGRLKPIKYGVVLIFIFSFLTSVSKSISQLIMMRILSGLAIGTVVPACKTLVTECIPSTMRSFVLSIIWILHPLGTVYICLIALNCVDGKDFNWRKVFMINSLNSFGLIILTQFLSESPRFLLKSGKSEEAIELLDLIGNFNKSDLRIKLNDNEKNMIFIESRNLKVMDIEEYSDQSSNSKSILDNLNKNSASYSTESSCESNDVHQLRNKNFNSINKSSTNFQLNHSNFENSTEGSNLSANYIKSDNKNEIFYDDKYTKIVKNQCNLNLLKLKKNLNTNSVKLLFTKKYLTTSLLLSIIWFSTSFLNFGLLYTLPKIFDKVSNNNKEDSMKKMIKTMLMVTPSAILRGYITEIKFLGRKNTLGLGFFGGLINSVLCYFITSYLHFFSGLLKFSIHISSGTVSIYTSEVYPTEIRSLAIGFGTSITRIGAFMSSYACEIFDGMTPKGSFIMFGITSFICWICSICLKYETLGKPLDFDEEEEEDENLKNEENEKLKISSNKKQEIRFQNKDNNFQSLNQNTGKFNKTIFDKNEIAEINLKNIII